MATLLNDALQQAERLAVENRELRRKQEDAVLDKCALCLRFPVGHGLVSCVCFSHSRACQVDADKQQPCSSVWVHIEGKTEQHGRCCVVGCASLHKNAKCRLFAPDCLASRHTRRQLKQNETGSCR